MPEFRFASPYLPFDAPVRWLRGNHHGHSTRSDGSDTPEANIAAYREAGYDYLALSEHDLFCDPAEHQAEAGLLLLPAVEVTSDLGQTLMYLGADPELPGKGAMSLAAIRSFVADRGGIFIVDHPNWRYRPDRLHASSDELLNVPELEAIEIYTGVIERLAGTAFATDVWDRLLSAGMRVFGHATDDQHAAVDRFLGWNMVQLAADEPPAVPRVLEALRQGRFVASTGPEVRRIGASADGTAVEIESDAQELRWIVRDGIVAKATAGGIGRMEVGELLDCPRVAATARWTNWASPLDLLYLRVECCGPGGRTAWSQPFFIAPETAAAR